MKKNIFKVVALVLFLALFIGIRVLYLNTTLWYDEACSWYSAMQSFPFGIMHNLTNIDLQHTPLYFFVLHFWMKIFGQGELALRILSLIFGILTVPLVYIVARKLTSKTIAMFSCAVVAFSPLLCLFSVEVRMYPIVVFLVMLSLNYLVDFEYKNDKKSLIRLIITNILIPYTYVGGILYNLSLLLCYGRYLYKNKKDAFKKYVSFECIEYVFLIPYFILITFYALKRNAFVVFHEGPLRFNHIVDVIRNFFGATIVPNIYWPFTDNYNITIWLTLLVIVPCVYFVYGIVKGFRIQDKFVNTLYKIFVLCFILFIVTSILKVHVFTVRYLLYLLAPLFILSVLGLFNSLKNRHCKIFLTLFILCSICFSLYNIPRFKVLKGQAFKAVRVEANELNLTNEDVVIMPFGADAPYYFRDFDSPVVFDFDYHKQVRNPKNYNYYDESMSKIMKSERKYNFVKQRVNDNSIFSKNFEWYFAENVSNSIPSGRYVLLALYASDADSVAPIQVLRQLVTDKTYLHQNFMDVMFRKYLCDVIEMLSFNFDLIKSYAKGNYTYYLFQKR